MSTTKRASRFLLLTLVLASLAAVPGASRADTLDTLLNLIEREWGTARPLTECLAMGNPVQSCAMQLAQDGGSFEVAGAMATQSSVVLVVEVIRAANARPLGWIRILKPMGNNLNIDMTYTHAEGSPLNLWRNAQ